MKEQARVVLLGADARWLEESLPDSASVSRKLGKGPVDLIVLLSADRRSLTERLERAAAAVYPDGSLWVGWPRKAAGHRSDLDENGVRSECLPLGLVDVKVAALSEDWSGLKLVWRKERR